MNTLPTQKTTKLKCLDSVRGLASVAVVLSHLSLIYFVYLHNFIGEDIPEGFPVQKFLHHSIFGFFYSGTSAVFVFFVMSGIVLSRGIEKRSDEYYFITSFTRYFRLAIPAAFSCLLMFAVLVFISGDFQQMPGVSDWIAPLLIDNPSLIGAFSYGAFGSFIGGPVWDGNLYNPVLWTMRIELIGSLFVYMACIIFKRSKVLSLSVFLIASLVILSFNSLIGFGMICFFCGFVYSAFDISYKNNLLGFLLVIVGLYLAGIHNDSESYRWLTVILKERSYLFFNFASGILIVYGVLISAFISRALENKWLVYLGKLSFPIYIIHFPVIMLTIYLTRDLATTSVASMLTVSAISLVGTVLLARFVVPVDDFSISFSKRVYNKITGLRMVRRTE